MNIEEELRGALDVSAPPPMTTLDDVLRRGKRRVYAKRGGAAFSALAVVALIGLATIIRPVTDSVPPALSPPWEMTPLSTPARVPLDGSCAEVQRTKPLTVAFGDAAFDAGNLANLVKNMGVELPAVQVGEAQARNNEAVLNVRDGRGEGSLRLWVGKFAGTPVEAADDGLWDYGLCSPGMRGVLPDGTVLQLQPQHSLDAAAAFAQVLFVYRADGSVYRIQQANSTLKLLSAGTSSERRELVLTDQVTLPLTDEQMGKLGLAVAEGV
ncbi:hypothetical protein [Lentzea albidocapillata]|uniref:Uncharacterized protein n=1 Tax=Lentzea albidocapillata TaxID=40571 RepID=A0A1W2FIF0_9PSEU|nr:hypothetical protein [Lentzea albidocapillata]SMD21563.1 hypothetical protein SAMN05660733_06469 [Lentzea albidocapillata]